MNESLEKIVQEAGTAYSEGRYDDSRKLYESAILNHPTNGILHANLSAILLRIGLVEKSLEHSQKSVELCPHWAKAHYRKGESLRTANRLHDALLAFSQGLRLDPTNCQLFKSLTETISISYKNFPWKSLNELKLDRDVATILSALGQEMLKEEHFDDAATILELSLQLDIKSVKLRESVLGSLGAAFCATAQYSNALHNYQLQLEAAEEIGDVESVPRIRENIAVVAEQCGNFMLAALQRTYRIEKDSYSSGGMAKRVAVLEEKLKIARLYLKMEQPNDVIIILKDCQKLFAVVEKTSDDPKIRGLKIEIETLFGQAHARKSDFKTALGILIPISRIKQDLELIETINRCMLELDDLKSSTEFLNNMATVVKDSDTMLHCYSLLCQTQISASNLSTALKLAKKVLKLARPNYRLHEANSYRLLAIIYEHQKDMGSAIVLWKKYLENEPVLTVYERVKALLQLGRLSQDETNAEDPEKFYDQAIKLLSGPESSKSVSDMVTCRSAKYRWNLSNFEFAKAKIQLDALKKILDSDTSNSLDSKTRSLIFEDIALFNGKAETSKSVIVLEQSLTEAQDSNDLYREMQILERIGNSFVEQKKLRLAEKYFCQQLEVARELRNVKAMADAHANVAKLKLSLDCMAEACDHARNALTLYKITTDHERKTEMLLILAKAEMSRNNIEVAISAVEKAISLAEDCASNEKLCKAYRIAADLYGITKQRKEMTIDFVERHISLLEFEKNPLERCRSLVEILEYEAIERDPRKFDARKCSRILELLKAHELNSGLGVRIANICAKSRNRGLKMESYAILDKLSCEVKKEKREEIIQIAEKLGTPYCQNLLLMLANDNSTILERILTDIELINPRKESREQSSSSFSEIVNAHFSEQWDTVLNLIRSTPTCQANTSKFLLSFPNLQVGQIIKLIEINAIWSLNKDESSLPDCQDLAEYYQLQIYDLFFNGRQQTGILSKLRINPMINSHFSMFEHSDFDMMAEGIRLVDKIICAAHLDERELIEMWYFELLEEFQSWPENLEIFQVCSDEMMIRYAAIFTALTLPSDTETEKFRILEVFDSCELALMKKSMPNVRNGSERWSLQKSARIVYIFQVHAITVVFVIGQDPETFQICWFEAANSKNENQLRMTFYDWVLKRLIESFGFRKLENEQELRIECDILVSERVWGNIDCKEHKYWLHEPKISRVESSSSSSSSSSNEPTIGCLSFIPNLSNVQFLDDQIPIVDGFPYLNTGSGNGNGNGHYECVKKMEKCRILIIDEQCLPLFEQQLGAIRTMMRMWKRAPSWVIVVGNQPLSSAMTKMLKYGGTQRIMSATRENLAQVLMPLQSADSNLLSTLRSDIRLALDGDYCMPSTPQLQLERVLNEVGKEAIITVLNLEKDGTLEINKWLSSSSEIQNNTEFRNFVKYIYGDHIFNQ